MSVLQVPEVIPTNKTVLETNKQKKLVQFDNQLTAPMRIMT